MIEEQHRRRHRSQGAEYLCDDAGNSGATLGKPQFRVTAQYAKFLDYQYPLLKEWDFGMRPPQSLVLVCSCRPARDDDDDDDDESFCSVLILHRMQRLDGALLAAVWPASRDGDGIATIRCLLRQWAERAVLKWSGGCWMSNAALP